MATKIKIIRSVDYLSITDDGIIEFEESKQKLSEIVEPKRPPADHEILLDFRRTQWVISTEEIYSLVKVLIDKPDSWRDKIAILVLPGVNFDKQYFQELCSTSEAVIVRPFSNYEDAVQWFYQG